MWAVLIAVLLSTAPGDGVGLAPGPGPASGPAAPTVPAAGEEPAPSEPEESALVSLGAILAAAGVLAAAGRPRGPAPGDGLGLRERPLVVFVPGHGNGPGDFDDLVALMDLGPDDHRVFDYRWAAESADPVHASQAAPIDDTADALNGYLAGIADGGRPVYLVGFSKGGAAVAELVSRWDAGTPPPVPGVVGAAMLDPPISGGLQGVVQSLGEVIGPIPDDGGYDPLHCRWKVFCEDTREHLGEEAGVEVMVLRNPKAGITNFDDRPEGLRIYDVPDEGRGPLAALAHNPFSYARRVAEAHEAVLHDPRVAECILSEMDLPGSCHIEAPRPPLARCGGSGGGGVPVLAD